MENQTGLGETGEQEAQKPAVPRFLKVLSVFVVFGVVAWVATALNSGVSEDSVLVKGVSYYGNFSGTELRTGNEAVIGMMTRYWGDTRFSTAQIPYELAQVTGPRSEDPSLEILANYFERTGYEVETGAYSGTDDLLQLLKEKNAPLVIEIKLPSEDYNFRVPAVLLGVDNATQSIEIHESFLGNNYKMSFDMFEKGLPNDREPRYLFVIPKETFIDISKIPERPASYSARLGIMDDPQIRALQFKWMAADLLELELNVDWEHVLNAWQEIVADGEFIRFRPSGQMWAYMRIARAYAELGDVDKAIQVMNEDVLPLNHDLEKGYGEWPPFSHLPAGSEWGRPWVSLGMLYAMKGDKVNARRYYDKALSIVPDEPNILQRIRELEAGTN